VADVLTVEPGAAVVGDTVIADCNRKVPDASLVLVAVLNILIVQEVPSSFVVLLHVPSATAGNGKVTPAGTAPVDVVVNEAYVILAS
jgi:hypothetical protein